MKKATANYIKESIIDEMAILDINEIVQVLKTSNNVSLLYYVDQDDFDYNELHLETAQTIKLNDTDNDIFICKFTSNDTINDIKVKVYQIILGITKLDIVF